MSEGGIELAVTCDFHVDVRFAVRLTRESVDVPRPASPQVGVARRKHDVVRIGPIVVQAFPDSVEPSLMSAAFKLFLSTFKYSSHNG